METRPLGKKGKRYDCPVRQEDSERRRLKLRGKARYALTTEDMRDITKQENPEFYERGDDGKKGGSKRLGFSAL